MAQFCTAQIPLNKIERIQIYINKNRRKTLEQIRAETGADYLLNGTLYDMNTGAVQCHLKADGKLICKPAYNVHGFAWDDPDSYRLELLPNVPKHGDNQRRNYIACTNLIVDGVPVAEPTKDPARKGSRGRSAIGIKDGCMTLWCSDDGSGFSRTPERLRDELAADGWESAIMLDGGGSSQCDFAGAKVESSRKVAHLILVYLKRDIKGGDCMATIHAYSKKKDGNKKLSANFKVKEFACNDGSDPVFVAEELVEVLQKIRDHFKKAVTINSAYRTPGYNDKVDGAAYSQHLYGTAADIVVKGISPAEVAAFAETLLPNTGGIGIYKTFTHVDVRDVKSRWNG